MAVVAEVVGNIRRFLGTTTAKKALAAVVIATAGLLNHSAILDVMMGVTGGSNHRCCSSNYHSCGWSFLRVR